MWPNPQETKDLVTFTEEILNRKLHFLGSGFDLDINGFMTIGKNNFRNLGPAKSFFTL